MILLTFLDTGCRVSELCGMNVEYVSIPLVRVLGKGLKEMLLAFSPAVQREMLRYLRVRGSLFGEEGPHFPSRKGAGRLCRSRVGRIVWACAERAGISEVRVTPHGFRRQYASAFLKGGARSSTSSRSSATPTSR
jgi:integrase/recombinase XerD